MTSSRAAENARVPRTMVGPGTRTGSTARETSGEVTLDLVEGDPLLRHRVPLADRHGLVVEGVEVDGHAERRADLVLTAVAATDGLGLVVVDVPDRTELGR